MKSGTHGSICYPLLKFTTCIIANLILTSAFSTTFVQLIGISVTGLEPEFQPVVDYLLPHIVSHRQDTSDLHLQVENTVTVSCYTDNKFYALLFFQCTCTCLC